MNMNDIKKLIIPVAILASIISCSSKKTSDNDDGKSEVVPKEYIKLADPTIYESSGKYYLYGTSPESNLGFLVYMSSDLEKWEGPDGKAANGYCLTKDSVWGTEGFWAPQVISYHGKTCMIYVANEQLAVAYSDSPLGIFTQDVKAQIPASMKEIDPFLYFENGKTYMYHIRLNQGNQIWVAEMSDDLSSMKEETAKLCIKATESWENTSNASWPVTEGPTVVKEGGKYFLFYSANDYRSQDYCVGVATSDSPVGPWTKQPEPIISKSNIGQNGTGHGDLFKDADGNWQYVFHTHGSVNSVQPRKTAIVQIKFENGKASIVYGTFHYLMADVKFQ